MKPRSRISIFTGLVVLIITGASLRMIHIGTPSMWVDEANTVFSAGSVLETGMPYMPTGNIYGRAPLYTYSVALTYRILGVSLENARLTSAIFGILCIPLVYAIAALLFGRRTALISALFVTISFYEIGWSRVARMYTLFQFFTLLSVLFFILGFERQILPAAGRKKTSWTIFRIPFLEGVDIVALLLFFLMTTICYFSVHRLTAFTVAALIFYILIRCLTTALGKSGSGRWLNKYSLSSMVILMAGVMAVIKMPSVIGSVAQFMEYTPAWAQPGSSASDPWILFRFLFSWYRFPLGLLFLWGTVQVVKRKASLGWMPVLLIFVPLVFLSFVFTHRHAKYLFGVYPFFLMLAAYGLYCLLNVSGSTSWAKLRIAPKYMKIVIPAVTVLVFLLSPWVRIAKNIPWQEDGKPNGAVHFNEWREAAQILYQAMKPGDLVICSLPEVLLYYNIKADWALNGSNLALSSRRWITDGQDRYMEVYSGRPLIESLNRLAELVETHARGWILITDYHFNEPIITPVAIREYITTHLPPPRLTKNGTIHIYSWDHITGEDHEF